MKLRDFVIIQGQLAQILDVKHKRKSKNCTFYTELKVKLVGDNLTHWINIKEIQTLKDQKAAKILFDKKSA